MKVEFGTAIFQVVVFLILLWVLNRYAWKPLAKTLGDRQAFIEAQISTAEKNRREAERLVEEHRSLLEQAKAEAHALIESARRSADRQAADILSLAESESKRLRAEAAEEIRREKEQALAAVANQVADLTVLLSGRVLARELDDATRRALVQEATKELGEAVC